MRRQPNRVGKGKTESQKQSQNKKREPLQELQNEPIHPEEPKQKLARAKKEKNSNFAIWADASPDTKKSIYESTTQKELTGIYSEKNLKPLEKSPGGSVNRAVSTTPRHRAFKLVRKWDIERHLANGTQKQAVIRVLTTDFDKREEPEIFSQLSDQAEFEYKTFGPFTITKEELLEILSRKEAKNQNSVMGEPAAQSVKIAIKSLPIKFQRLAEKLETLNFHWSHILCYIILAAVSNPQVSENLFLGSDKSNWSKKHFEIALRDLLRDHDLVTSITIRGSAKVFRNTHLAVFEELHYELNCSNHNSQKSSLSFNTLRSSTEYSMVARLWSQGTKGIIKADDESLQKEMQFSRN